jgi:hypothetical protein
VPVLVQFTARTRYQNPEPAAADAKSSRVVVTSSFPRQASRAALKSPPLDLRVTRLPRTTSYPVADGIAPQVSRAVEAAILETLRWGIAGGETPVQGPGIGRSSVSLAPTVVD